MSPSVPDISSLQQLALSALVSGALSGRELRDVLNEFGVRRTRAAFYQFMARLERDDLVAGEYVQTTVEGSTVTERRYTLTAAGRKALAEAADFHRALDVLGLPGAADA